MPYPTPTSEQLQRFSDDGFLVVENAIDPRGARRRSCAWDTR